MSRTLLVLAMAGLGSLFATHVQGQAPAPLTPGQTVRIRDGTGYRHTGVLLAISSDSLTLENRHRFHTYALADLSTIEEKTGTYTSSRTILITMGVAALAGGLAAAMAYRPCHEEGILACFMVPESPGAAFILGCFGGAVLGLPVGLILTPVVKYSRWKPASAPASPRVGLGLRVTVPLHAR